MANVKFLTGNKEKINSELSAGKIDFGSVILTSDTDELVFINPKTGKKVIQSKTQQAHTLQGVTLGDLKDGETIREGIDIDELINLLTKKTIPPTYIPPDLIFEHIDMLDDTYEVGTIINPSFKSTFIQNNAGGIESHEILMNNTIVQNGLSFATVEARPVSITIGEKPITFYSKVQYRDGLIKTDNLGNENANGMIKAGEIKSNEISIKGSRKLFYGAGVGEIPTLNSSKIRELNSKLNPLENMEFLISVEKGQQYVIFAYPSSLRDVKEITYMEAHDTKMALNFDMQIIEIEGANGFSPIFYKVYTYKMDGPAATSMTFKVTI